MTAYDPLPGRAAYFLLLAPMVLTAGVCGSVLRGHVPEDWPPCPDGGFVRTFGDVEVNSSHLHRLGRSWMALLVTNRGEAPLVIERIDLDADGRIDAVAGGTIPPGGTATLHPEWDREVSSTRCRVVLVTPSGTLEIPLVDR